MSVLRKMKQVVAIEEVQKGKAKREKDFKGNFSQGIQRAEKTLGFLIQVLVVCWLCDLKLSDLIRCFTEMGFCFIFFEGGFES